MSSVARAGELVSPALISPPRPLDLLRDRVALSATLTVLMLLKPMLRSCEGGESGGKASVAGILCSVCVWHAIGI